MATQVQIRKGTTAQHASFTGAVAELSVDTDKKTVVVHDGTTAGGVPLVTNTRTETITGTKTFSNAVLTTSSFTNNPTLSGGTANGVLYLNGSKVATSGSALVFDGTNLGIGVASPTLRIQVAVSGATTTFDGLNVTNGTAQYRLGLTGASYSYAGAGANETWLYSAGTTPLTLGPDGNAPIKFVTNGSEAMRLTSTGLGIGTSSPSTKLHVAGTVVSNQGVVKIQDLGGSGTSSYPVISLYDAGGTIQGNLGMFAGDQVVENKTASGKILFKTNSTTVGTIDSSGNLGLGVTPSVWSTQARAIQIGNYSAFYQNVSGNPEISFNSYQNASNIDTYKVSANTAGKYQISEAHKWFTAPSGTAGNAITFTQAMTLDASGNLVIGDTSASGARLKVLGSGGGQLYVDLSGTNYYNATAHIFQSNAGGTERARIDSSGNLLVGTTSQITGEKFAADTTGASAKAITARNNAGSGAATIFVWNSATSGDNLFMGFGTEANGAQRGSISYNRTGGLTAYNTTSDYRAKDITGPVENSGALIDSVPVYMGKMKGATQERPMFIAHETPAYAHTGVKDAVDADGNPVYQQMDASALIPVMWAEIQSLRKRLADAGIA